MAVLWDKKLQRVYGFGTSGTIGRALLGLGGSGRIGSPLCGLGISGTIGSALLLKPYEIAALVASIAITVITNERKRLAWRVMMFLLGFEVYFC